MRLKAKKAIHFGKLLSENKIHTKSSFSLLI